MSTWPQCALRYDGTFAGFLTCVGESFRQKTYPFYFLPPGGGADHPLSPPGDPLGPRPGPGRLPGLGDCGVPCLPPDDDLRLSHLPAPAGAEPLQTSST